ncbi:MAG: hypothetical protein BYD32DRAFT_441308 [Podila humilis]|nr:MAG: hypothetical protein BYD32DRAFT_441308 [Podila humilis]
MADNSTDLRSTGNADGSGWYIYAILVITATFAVVFFGRVCHAKRKERIRAEKDRDCEEPPGYLFHAHDLQVFNGAHRVSVPEQAYALSPPHNHPLVPPLAPPLAPPPSTSPPTLPTITVVSDTHSYEPPAYEDLNK